MRACGKRGDVGQAMGRPQEAGVSSGRPEWFGASILEVDLACLASALLTQWDDGEKIIKNYLMEHGIKREAF